MKSASSPAATVPELCGRFHRASELIGRRITDARTRINICSPVLTSAEVLKALVARIEAKTIPAGTTIAIDGPQMHGAISQWKHNDRASWKVPLVNPPAKTFT